MRSLVLLAPRSDGVPQVPALVLDLGIITHGAKGEKTKSGNEQKRVTVDLCEDSLNARLGSYRHKGRHSSTYRPSGLVKMSKCKEG